MGLRNGCSTAAKLPNGALGIFHSEGVFFLVEKSLQFERCHS